ncbi:FAD-dependent oxidoreductase [Candidatus Micrarchaeota archaeon]|jgi:ferredoxin-NADP reductase|nr:FAD-dependent oxidoreductase [Candidatus Micrarchaeota archaeon]
MSKLKKYQIKKILKFGQNIRSFILEPLEFPIVKHYPGQFITFHLYENLEKEELWEVARAYSIVSSPHEYPNLELCIKLQGTFTNKLWELKEGDITAVGGPFGAHNLSKGSSPLVFFAGGVGITPIMSLLRFENTKNKRKIKLFYSNRTLESTPYLNELKKYSLKSKFEIIFLFTGDKTNFGEHCRISKEIIEKYISKKQDFDYFICGPKSFAGAVESILKEMDIPQEKIYSESW